MLYWQSHYYNDVHAVDTSDDVSMDERYATYVDDDEHADNYDYGDNTHDNNDKTNHSYGKFNGAATHHPSRNGAFNARVTPSIFTFIIINTCLYA